MSRATKLVRYADTGYHLVKNRILTKRSVRQGRMLTGPGSAYFILTNHCNCNCIQCPAQVAEDAKTEKLSDNLTLDEYATLIDDLVSSGCKRIGLTGGEPLILKQKIVPLLEKINERAYSQIVTNGSLLDEAFLDHYDSIGGGHITFSIDGIGERHDQIRRKPGLFRKIEDTLDLLHEKRYRNIMPKITFTLFNDNVDEMVPVANHFLKRKIPLFIGPYENYDRKKSLEYNRQDPLWIQADKEAELRTTLKQMIELRQQHPHLIINSKAHFLAIEDYFLAPEQLASPDRACHYGYTTVHIRPDGRVATCIGDAGSIREEPFFKIWDGDKFHRMRRVQLRCDKNCMLGCIVQHSFLDMVRVVGYQLLKR